MDTHVYLPGDWVEILPKPSFAEAHASAGPGWAADMDKMVGKVYQIAKLSSKPDWYIVGGWTFSSNWLKPIDEQHTKITGEKTMSFSTDLAISNLTADDKALYDAGLIELSSGALTSYGQSAMLNLLAADPETRAALVTQAKAAIAVRKDRDDDY